MLSGVVILLLAIRCGKANQFDSNKRYECGPHGRFEYCIDGFSGCIVGCHCYPGYYFDTETKICEPSTKLIKASRRFYEEREEVSTQLPVRTTTAATTSTTEYVAKDLGDWLYNQFFRTVENQVVNHTGVKVQTRRSGNWPGLRKGKKRRRNSKKKKKKQQQLRRKMLRISPDNSIFDSRDRSGTSDSSSETDSDDSSSSSSSSSGESPPDKKDTKKLVIYNRRPKMSLPSFLFLPNMETPFFPPLALPPPALPMYPLVPVPPVMPNMFPPPPPFPLPPPPPLTPCVSTSTSTHKTTTPEKVSKIVPQSNEDGDQETPGKKLHGRPRRPEKKVHKPKLTRKQQALSPEDDDDYEMYDDAHMNAVERPPGMDEVRFKYLTQLIHRQAPNITKGPNMAAPLGSELNIFQHPVVPKPVSKKKRIIGNRIPGPHKAIPPPRPPADTRRMNDDPNAETADPPADRFYSDLGKQIASLIRKADTQGNTQDTQSEREIAIEVNDMVKANSVINVNNIPSRSYWDRFVRSPVSHDSQLPDVYGDGRELLYDLENQVAMVSKDLPSLNLVQLENIALRNTAPPDVLESTQAPLDNSFKLNLLPVFSHGYNEAFYMKPSTPATPIHEPALKFQELRSTLVTTRNNTNSVNILPTDTAKVLFQPGNNDQTFIKPISQSQQFFYIQKLHRDMRNGKINGTFLRIVPIKISRDLQNPYTEMQREVIRKTLSQPRLEVERLRNYNYLQKRIIQKYNSPKRMNNRVFHGPNYIYRDAERKYAERKYF